MDLGRSGCVDAHLRALEGFPSEGDFSTPRLEPRYAIVEIVVRKLHACDEDTDAEPRDARFLCLRRSLADLLHLEARLATYESSSAAPPLGIAASVAAYELAQSRPRFGSLARQTERLLVELETALTALLSSPSARRARAVQLFFGYDAVVRVGDSSAVVERCLELSGPEIQEETMVGGASVCHDVSVDANATSHLFVVWKFAFTGDATDVCVTFTPRGDESATQGDSGDAADMDPYSEAAIAWNDTSAERSQDDGERTVLQYTTRYTRLRSEEAKPVWIYGASRVPDDARGGIVTFEWADAGEPSIFSSTLQFQARVCSADDTDPEAWAALSTALGEEEEEKEDDSLAWVEAIISTSSLTTWPTETVERPSLAVGDTYAANDMMSSAESSRQRDQQLREMQGKMFKLEEELLAVRQELKATKSELEISSEIYKASLETIAQLETAPMRSQQSQSRRARHNSPSAINDDENDDKDDADSYDEEDGQEYGSDEDEAEEEPADGETMRLRDLVATFQEQCLWRSIETSESEKRNLMLEGELQQLDQEKRSLAEKLVVRDAEVAALRAEANKLKTQKAVLVKEVKRLQPYSQVNLSALIREAEEARMMQRSLQAQLHALTSASSPETDRPVAAAVVDRVDE